MQPEAWKWPFLRMRSKLMAKNQLKRCPIAQISVLLWEIYVVENDGDTDFGTEVEITAFLHAQRRNGQNGYKRLPPHVRDAGLPYSRFRRSLKTFLFG